MYPDVFQFQRPNVLLLRAPPAEKGKVDSPKEAPDIADRKTQMQRDGKTDEISGNPALEKSWQVRFEAFNILGIAISSAT